MLDYNYICISIYTNYQLFKIEIISVMNYLLLFLFIACFVSMSLGFACSLCH